MNKSDEVISEASKNEKTNNNSSTSSIAKQNHIKSIDKCINASEEVIETVTKAEIATASS